MKWWDRRPVRPPENDRQDYGPRGNLLGHSLGDRFASLAMTKSNPEHAVTPQDLQKPHHHRLCPHSDALHLAPRGMYCIALVLLIRADLWRNKGTREGLKRKEELVMGGYHLVMDGQHSRLIVLARSKRRSNLPHHNFVDCLALQLRNEKPHVIEGEAKQSPAFLIIFPSSKNFYLPQSSASPQPCPSP